MTPMELGSAIEVRLAAFDEAPSIAAVLRDAFVEFEPLYTPAAFAATTPTADQIRSRWDEGPVWVALASGALVGTVAAVPREEFLYVRSMGILPSARGRGIGTRMLQLVEGFARGRRLGSMCLSTTPFLLQAIRRYERFGFVRSDDGPFDLFGTPLFTMVKCLRSA